MGNVLGDDIDDAKTFQSVVGVLNKNEQFREHVRLCKLDSKHIDNVPNEFLTRDFVKKPQFQSLAP